MTAGSNCRVGVTTRRLRAEKLTRQRTGSEGMLLPVFAGLISRISCACSIVRATTRKKRHARRAIRCSKIRREEAVLPFHCGERTKVAQCVCNVQIVPVALNTRLSRCILTGKAALTRSLIGLPVFYKTISILSRYSRV